MDVSKVRLVSFMCVKNWTIFFHSHALKICWPTKFSSHTKFR